MLSADNVESSEFYQLQGITTEPKELDSLWERFIKTCNNEVKQSFYGLSFTCHNCPKCGVDFTFLLSYRIIIHTKASLQ